MSNDLAFTNPGTPPWQMGNVSCSVVARAPSPSGEHVIVGTEPPPFQLAPMTVAVGVAEPPPGAITLTGFTGAGIRASTSPLLTDDFDAYAVDAPLNTLGYDGQAGPKIAADTSYWGTKAAKHSYGLGNGFPRVHRKMTERPNRVYVALHAYWELGGLGAGEVGVFKLIRGGSYNLPGEGSPGVDYHGSPAFYETVFDSDGDGVLSGADKGIRRDADTDVYKTNQAISSPFNAGQWTFIEFLYDQGTPGNFDASLHQWVNGKKNTTVTGVNALKAGSAKRIDWIMTIFDGLDDSHTGVNLWQQDFYIDSTPQRVMLTDSADYTTSTIFIIQEIVAWSDTSIIVNPTTKGLFAPGATGYFHAFGEDGQSVAVREVVL